MDCRLRRLIEAAAQQAEKNQLREFSEAGGRWTVILTGGFDG
jgi:hypothetical protein